MRGTGVVLVVGLTVGLAIEGGVGAGPAIAEAATTFSINADDVMWSFFEAHPRRG